MEQGIVELLGDEDRLRSFAALRAAQDDNASELCGRERWLPVIEVTLKRAPTKA
jgi:hypothetical protein